jgi:hypothetical protein
VGNLGQASICGFKIAEVDCVPELFVAVHFNAREATVCLFQFCKPVEHFGYSAMVGFS